MPLKDTWTKRETSVEGSAGRTEGTSAPRESPPRDAKPKTPGTRSAPRTQDPAVLARVARYSGELGVSGEHAELLADDPAWAEVFEAGLDTYDDAAGLAGWIVTDLRGLAGDRTPGELLFGGPEVARLAALVDEGAVSRRAAKDVLARMVEQGGDPTELVEAMGLTKMGDPDELGAVVDGVLEAWPDKVTEYQSGKTGLIGLFVGEVMKKTGGAADPQTAKDILLARLSD